MKVEGAGSQPKLSLILCSRNDRYQGDSVWRLETALNYAAMVAADVGRLGELEILVSDWGSETPLRDVVALTDEAARVVRFLWIPPEVARTKQGDSQFPEVLALNAALRRATGEYVGRIDQDTLISRRFLETFFWLSEKRRLLVPLEEVVLISNRRSIPRRVAVRAPSLAVLDRLIGTFGRSLRLTDPPPPEAFYRCFVGILLMHGDLWRGCRGFDERFIHMDHMELEIMLRLSTRYQVADLGPIVDWAFYHLDHERPWLRRRVNQGMRRGNPRRTVDDMPEEFAPNGDDWGLARYDLQPLPARVETARLSTPRPLTPATGLRVAGLLLLAGAEMLAENLFYGGRRRLRETVIRLHLYPVVAWIRRTVA